MDSNVFRIQIEIYLLISDVLLMVIKENIKCLVGCFLKIGLCMR